MAKILIIEDNPVNMKLTKLLVRRAGHTAVEAVNAENGLLLAQSEVPDVILMDVQLPGMDGFAATAILKNDPITADIPVIALTAMAMSRDEDRARDAGCDAYITKPLHYQELHDAISWLMPRSDSGFDADWPADANHELNITHSTTSTRPGPSRVRSPGMPRILIAEQNPANQKLIAWQLTLLGYDADIVGDGASALARWTTGNFDMVITNLHMPELDGYELAAAIRLAETEKSRIPILGMTASEVWTEMDPTRTAGINAYLFRPVHLAKLRKVLNEWLPEDSRPQKSASKSLPITKPSISN